jgi:hypothetical protein
MARRTSSHCISSISIITGGTEEIEILDAGGVVVDTRTVSSFSGGQYLVWNLSGR